MLLTLNFIPGSHPKLKEFRILYFVSLLLMFNALVFMLLFYLKNDSIERICMKNVITYEEDNLLRQIECIHI